jgi:hypothetical protein
MLNKITLELSMNLSILNASVYEISISCLNHVPAQHDPYWRCTKSTQICHAHL